MLRHLLALPLALLPALAAADAPVTRPDARKDHPAFGLDRVLKLHLKITEADWKAMQPAGGGFGFPGGPGGPGGRPGGPGGPFGGPKDAPKEDAAREKPKDVHRSAFGTELPYVRAELECDGKTIKDIAVRYKGNFTFMTSAGRLKRPLKLDFNRHVEGQTFLGLKALNLNTGGADPTLLREPLAFRTFALAGVPSPRTAHAELYLTVPGKYDREFVGVYVLIEEVDRTFLKDRYGAAKGLLLKPEGVRELEYLGGDWSAYERRYRPKGDVKREHAKRLIALAKLIHRADDVTFRKEINSLLDVDEFLRFVAATAMVSNLDTFMTMGHNYYLYLDPKTNRFQYLPWDEDFAFAGMGMFGSGDQLAQLNVLHPYGGNHKLVERVLAIPEYKEAYRAHVKKLAAAMAEQLGRDLPVAEAAVKEPMRREARAVAARKEAGPGGFGPGGPGGRPGGPGGPGGMGFGRSADLRKFIAARAASVEDQLAGKSKGFTPQPFGGPGGRPGGPGGPGFGPGGFLAGPLLKAADADKDNKLSRKEWLAAADKFFADADPDKKGYVTEESLTKALKAILPAPPFGPPGGNRGPGMEVGVAQAIVKRVGADKDGKIGREAWDRAAGKLFDEADRERKGSLDERAINGGIALVLPRPGGPGFGPGGPGGRPGFGPGGFFAGPLLTALDADKDNKVSRKEWLAASGKLFKDADPDGKGFVTEESLTKALKNVFPAPPFAPPEGFRGPEVGVAQAIVKRAGADKDGQVSRKAWDKAAEVLFDEMDRDFAGFLDQNKLAAGIGLVMPFPGGPGGPGGFGPGPGGPGGPKGPGGRP